MKTAATLFESACGISYSNSSTFENCFNAGSLETLPPGNPCIGNINSATVTNCWWRESLVGSVVNSDALSTTTDRRITDANLRSNLKPDGITALFPGLDWYHDDGSTMYPQLVPLLDSGNESWRLKLSVCDATLPTSVTVNIGEAKILADPVGPTYIGPGTVTFTPLGDVDVIVDTSPTSSVQYRLVQTPVSYFIMVGDNKAILGSTSSYSIQDTTLDQVRPDTETDIVWSCVGGTLTPNASNPNMADVVWNTESLSDPDAFTDNWYVQATFNGSMVRTIQVKALIPWTPPPSLLVLEPDQTYEIPIDIGYTGLVVTGTLSDVTNTLGSYGLILTDGKLSFQLPWTGSGGSLTIRSQPSPTSGKMQNIRLIKTQPLTVPSPPLDASSVAYIRLESSSVAPKRVLGDTVWQTDHFYAAVDRTAYGYDSTDLFEWTIDPESGVLISGSNSDVCIVQWSDTRPANGRCEVKVSVARRQSTSSLRLENAFVPGTTIVTTQTFGGLWFPGPPEEYAMTEAVPLSLNSYDLTVLAGPPSGTVDDTIHIKGNLNPLLLTHLVPYGFVSGSEPVAECKNLLSALHTTWKSLVHPDDATKTFVVQMAAALERLFDISPANEIDMPATVGGVQTYPTQLSRTLIESFITEENKAWNSLVFTASHLLMFLDAMYDRGQLGSVLSGSDSISQVAHGTKFLIPIVASSQTNPSLTRRWNFVFEQDGFVV